MTEKTVPMKYRRMEFNAQLQTENDRLRAQRDALLEALCDLVQLEADGRTEYESAIPHWDAARAAIKQAEGKNR